MSKIPPVTRIRQQEQKLVKIKLPNTELQDGIFYIKSPPHYDAFHALAASLKQPNINVIPLKV